MIADPIAGDIISEDVKLGAPVVLMMAVGNKLETWNKGLGMLALLILFTQAFVETVVEEPGEGVFKFISGNHDIVFLFLQDFDTTGSSVLICDAGIKPTPRPQTERVLDRIWFETEHPLCFRVLDVELLDHFSERLTVGQEV